MHPVLIEGLVPELEQRLLLLAFSFALQCLIIAIICSLIPTVHLRFR